MMNNLLRTLTKSSRLLQDTDSSSDLKLLLTTVKDGRRHNYDPASTKDTKASSAASAIADPFYDALEALLLDLRTITIDNRDPEAFLRPVLKADVPDYYDIIAKPMDLQTMLRKVKSKSYKSKRDFKDDLDLIWSNCRLYNAAETHPLRACAARLERKANKLLEYITDRKDRTDPPILSSFNGTSNKLHNRVVASSSTALNNGTSIVNGIAGPSTPTINGHTRTPLHGRPFADTPAIIRTPEGMSRFANLEAQYRVVEDVVGDKRKSTPSTDGARPAKRPRLGLDITTPNTSTTDNSTNDLTTPSFLDDIIDPAPWWNAVQSDDLLGNGLPLFPHAASSSSSSTTTKQRRRHRHHHHHHPKSSAPKPPTSQPPDAPAPKRTMLSMLSSNIRTMKRVRNTHAKFAALNARNGQSGSGASGPGGDEDTQPADDGGGGGAAGDNGTAGGGDVGDEALSSLVEDDRVDDRPWDLRRFAAPSLPAGAPHKSSKAKGKERAREREDGTRRKGKRRGDTPDYGDDGPEVEVGEEAATHCLKWMGEKVLEHSGFQGSSTVALDVLATVTSEYLLNVGRTLRFLSDKYGGVLTPEEIILHALFESGTSKITDLERYISDDVERYGTRLGDLEKKLVGAYREATAVESQVLDDGDLFGEDEEEDASAFGMGNFTEAIGDDFFGFRELGIAAEFGMTNLSIPKRLLKSKKRGQFAAGANGDIEKPKEPPVPFPLPPPFIPIDSTSVNRQIGLLRDYYQDRIAFIANHAPPPPPPPPPSLSQLPTNPPSGAMYLDQTGNTQTMAANMNAPGLPFPGYKPPGPFQLPALSGPTLGIAPLAPPPPPPPPPQGPMAPPPQGLPSAPAPSPIVVKEEEEPLSLIPSLPIVLPDDPPNPGQVKMGPLGQILKAGAGKKKNNATNNNNNNNNYNNNAAVNGVGADGQVPKVKKKKGATGVGTGNGRKKKKKEEAAAALAAAAAAAERDRMSTSATPAPIVAMG